ncbi:MAG: universal stress protein [Desulfovibrionaceae bacterium]|nr:universal stress protein [Desulfovibrionaceae bacterium]MBF0513546.1 universal stress protein [Desulfovibrionaceae bacterium]
MEKHLLVTISDDPRMFYGLNFLTRFFTAKDTLRLTLLHIAAGAAAVWPEEMNYESIARRDGRARDIEEKGRAALEAAEKMLLAGGFDKSRLHTKLVFGGFSRNKIILHEGEAGLYDAVVLGQRGYDTLRDLLDHSLSLDLLRGAFPFPLWICRLPKFGRKNVLVAVDGSEPSLRIADHAGFILSRGPGHDIVLFHVAGPKSAAPGPEFFDECRELIAKAGFPFDRIRTKTVVAAGVPAAILAEAESGRYAAVALGRTGIGKSGDKDKGAAPKAFFGAVSNDIFHNLAGAVMWVSR